MSNGVLSLSVALVAIFVVLIQHITSKLSDYQSYRRVSHVEEHVAGERGFPSREGAHHRRSSIDRSASLISSRGKEMLPPCPASTYSKWNCSKRLSERF
jgi:hypothetical protein